MKSNSSFSAFKMAHEFLLAQKVVVHAFEQTTSTNLLAKENAAKDTGTVVYLAAEQSAGRGRYERSWQNGQKPGDQLLISFSFALTSPAQAITGPLIGDILYRAVQAAWPEGAWGLKPPNDIYLKDKKILGVLIESVTLGAQHRLIVGIGLNVFSHPTDVSHAGHLTEQLTVTTTHLETFFMALLKSWPIFLSQCTKAEMTGPTRERLIQALNRCPLNPQPYLDITAHGDLITSSATISWRNL